MTEEILTLEYMWGDAKDGFRLIYRDNTYQYYSVDVYSASDVRLNYSTATGYNSGRIDKDHWPLMRIEEPRGTTYAAITFRNYLQRFGHGEKTSSV